MYIHPIWLCSVQLFHLTYSNCITEAFFKFQLSAPYEWILYNAKCTDMGCSSYIFIMPSLWMDVFEKRKSRKTTNMNGFLPQIYLQFRYTKFSPLYPFTYAELLYCKIYGQYLVAIVICSINKIDTAYFNGSRMITMPAALKNITLIALYSYVVKCYHRKIIFFIYLSN